MYYRDMRPLIQYLEENARMAGERVALRSDNCKYTWKECLNIVRSLCRELQTKHSLGDSTVIIYQCENRPNNALMLFALLCSGCQVAIVTTSTEPQAVNCAVSNGWHYVCVSGVDGLNLHAKNYQGAPSVLERYDTRRTHVILYTSGTESSPKGIVLSQYSVLNNARNLADCMGLVEADRVCLIPGIHHCFGLLTLLSSVAIGAEIYFPETRNYGLLLQKIATNKITIVNTVPTIFLGMCRELDVKRVDVSSVRGGIIAGGTYSPTQFQKIENAFSMKLMASYGLTECCATVTFCRLDEDCSYHVGQFIDGVQGCIKTLEGNASQPGCEGEICVKGYNLMRGLLSGGQFFPCPIDEEGWYHTGDLGCLDNVGRLSVTGRLKNIIIRGGENISVTKLTEAALSYSGILECVVVGVPNAFYGEVPCMAIRTTEEHDVTGLQSHLKKTLLKHECPVRIVAMDNLPINNNGKYDYKALQCLFKAHFEGDNKGDK